MPVPTSGEDKVRILRASGSALIELENKFDTTQSAVVDDLIEDSCWSTAPALRTFVGGGGTGEQRLGAILLALDTQ